MPHRLVLFRRRTTPERAGPAPAVPFFPAPVSRAIGVGMSDQKTAASIVIRAATRSRAFVRPGVAREADACRTRRAGSDPSASRSGPIPGDGRAAGTCSFQRLAAASGHSPGKGGSGRRPADVTRRPRRKSAAGGQGRLVRPLAAFREQRHPVRCAAAPPRRAPADVQIGEEWGVPGGNGPTGTAIASACARGRRQPARLPPFVSNGIQCDAPPRPGAGACGRADRGGMGRSRWERPDSDGYRFSLRSRPAVPAGSRRRRSRAGARSGVAPAPRQAGRPGHPAR